LIEEQDFTGEFLRGSAGIRSDPRLPIIAQMATTIFVEKQIYRDDRDARRIAIDQAILLYGEIAIRLAENDR
jgi:hypothetical protein